MYWLIGRKSAQAISNQLGLNPVQQRSTTYTSYRYPRTLPLGSFEHYSECTLIDIEYGYPNGSPSNEQSNKESVATTLDTVLGSAHIQTI
jgi:hypothetical protein